MKTVNISDELHKKYKIEAAKRELEIQELVDLALKEYFTKKK